MSDTIIRVENLGKKYIIGHQQEGRSNYVALRNVIALEKGDISMNLTPYHQDILGL